MINNNNNNIYKEKNWKRKVPIAKSFSSLFHDVSASWNAVQSYLVHQRADESLASDSGRQNTSFGTDRSELYRFAFALAEIFSQISQTAILRRSQSHARGIPQQVGSRSCFEDFRSEFPRLVNQHRSVRLSIFNDRIYWIIWNVI